MSFYSWQPYVSVAERRVLAAKQVAKLKKKGREVSPVVLPGKIIAHTFWGKSWCNNLECYSDFENRLPRGRTYVRNGSVIDLQIKPGAIEALVSGSSIYSVKISIMALALTHWKRVVGDCGRQVGSVVELLQGSFSNEVMRILTTPQTGLFPSPQEMSFRCSCPDWADMCKHVAAALYGVGARLDAQPQLFFTLRQVDETELIAQAASAGFLTQPATGKKQKLLDKAALASTFGIDFDESLLGGETLATPAAPAPAPETDRTANDKKAKTRASKTSNKTSKANPKTSRRGKGKQQVEAKAKKKDTPSTKARRTVKATENHKSTRSRSKVRLTSRSRKTAVKELEQRTTPKRKQSLKTKALTKNKISPAKAKAPSKLKKQ